MPLTNAWNRGIYRLWSPAYDLIFARFFTPGRLQAHRLLDLQAGERVLLPGVGTGLDLALLPEGVMGVGIDLSPAMLKRAQVRQQLSGRQVLLVQGDVQSPLVRRSCFDAVLFNLILSVVPDGKACFETGFEALVPGGRAVIFDKFLPDTGSLSTRRRLLNLGASLLGTDINRRLGELLAGCNCRVAANEPSLLGGAYRVILIQK
jgi:phosphatidylethanolamine/phosphatidyl-N-methylethanolamine N-methyltransferase